MLKSVLSGEKCAQCRNCCVFFSKSRWEMPSVPKENAEKIREFLKDENAVAENDGVFKLKSVLRSDVPESCEEYRCPALDERSGCTLPPELKPVECSMWPVRVMNDNGKIYITLAKGCHAVEEEFVQNVKKLLDSGLTEKIISSAKTQKGLIKPYDNSYIKLVDITEENLKNEQ